MPDLKEDILQFIWQYKLLKPVPLRSASGKEITIIKPGDLNKDSGPDFFNAHVKIDDITLAGNVEVHVKTSDWLKHKHQTDKSYDNIILHVVYEHDKTLLQNEANNVEVLEIKNIVPEALLSNYEGLIVSKQSLPCEGQLKNVAGIKFTAWLQRMLAERLEHKVERIEKLFRHFSGNYAQVFYAVLLRNFGFKVNSIPFEMLATHLPLAVLLKHSDNMAQLESLLLGTAGLLEEQFADKYVLSLQNEFEYLKKKYSIAPMRKELFKFSKLRPANFPTLRLAQFARLINTHPELFHSPQNFTDFKTIEKVLTFEMDGYWKNHYSPGASTTARNLQLGADSVSNIVVNTFAPFFFFYSKKTGISELSDVPLNLLENCNFENNAKTRQFSQRKEELASAADSQALINLYDNYCTRRKCLECGIATAILQSN